MSALEYTIHVYSNDDVLPREVEHLFAEQLTESRDEPDGSWRFVNICAVTLSGHVLGGLHMDVGPMQFGPLAEERLAYLEHLFVRPAYRNYGIATALLRRAVGEATARRCDHIRFNVSWNNPAMIAVCRKTGFALTCLEDGDYFAIKPTGSAVSHAVNAKR